MLAIYSNKDGEFNGDDKVSPNLFQFKIFLNFFTWQSYTLSGVTLPREDFLKFLNFKKFFNGLEWQSYTLSGVTLPREELLKNFKILKNFKMAWSGKVTPSQV